MTQSRGARPASPISRTDLILDMPVECFNEWLTHKKASLEWDRPETVGAHSSGG
jgi:hypothetical protein